PARRRAYGAAGRLSDGARHRDDLYLPGRHARRYGSHAAGAGEVRRSRGYERRRLRPLNPPRPLSPLVLSVQLRTGGGPRHVRDHQTRRLDLPVTGWYNVELTGFGSTRGAYRLLVESLGTAPEHVAAVLAPGDSVTTESIDTPGDWDEYTVTATPGQELAVIM